MKIYTKTGDHGETGLFGGGRVSKDNLRIEAYGTIDELNSVLGVTINDLKDKGVISLIEKIQRELFVAGSDLAAPRDKENARFQIPRVEREFSQELERQIDFYTDQLEELKNFILPGGTRSAAQLHHARTVCRRAERLAVALNKTVEIGENIIVYLNRLSDLLFVLARYENKVAGVPDVIWKNE
ncbi:MAG: cob(I)yrinic acid a,c-diamide adenosyltransferase [Ignavibacteria bacterium]|jgi:cob(I)alamin adenosyltransferase|nr:cob(I)yrinic acid a,c-diamide adenosyltransferase [Ignavibacteria bacterium]MCU7503069.1 cob(I)yrinic acid a,c-diamide adenosyltransferase [Ignavibacteria bacterium]MCU7516511.1 cob(I)yrinic acid a,c-diamide adenosyltransferase [Ignavibacteria bacterium]